MKTTTKVTQTRYDRTVKTTLPFLQAAPVTGKEAEGGRLHCELREGQPSSSQRAFGVVGAHSVWATHAMVTNGSQITGPAAQVCTAHLRETSAMGGLQRGSATLEPALAKAAGFVREAQP